ncbi:MAG: formylglycine-generating enzyme family protein [Proteobacteria bacterium]|nr:formylglycine-generating enzyme family protein [Pseudomonadota bacterium]
MPYDLQCEEVEKPMVEVALSPFWIDEKEATLEEIVPYLNWLLSQDEYVWDGYIYRVSDHMPMWMGSQNSGSSPIGLNGETGEFEYFDVEGVCTARPLGAATGGLSWAGAKLYCDWRGKRLPTEAEWEAAARGQTKWIYPCAWEHLDCAYGKYDCCGPEPSCPGVCQDPCCIPFEDAITNCPSPFGVKEMYGNAQEWVLDHMDDESDHSWCAGGCTDPAPRTGEGAILKGGGVGSKASGTRISRRAGPALLAGPYNGVRCVSSPVDFILSDGGVVWGE